MLELPRCVPLGVDVADFLHLKGTLERHRIVDPTADVDHVVHFVELTCDRFHDPGVLEHLFALLTQAGQLGCAMDRGFGTECSISLPEVKGDQIERYELGHE